MLTTIQQNAVDAIINAIDTGQNLIVKSTAGSGKTYVVEQTSYKYTGTKRIVACAYNRKAADELMERCKTSTFKTINTMHSIGNRTIKTYGKPGNVAFWYAANIVSYNPKIKDNKDNKIAWFIANNASQLADTMKSELSDDTDAILAKYDRIKTMLYKTDYTGQIVSIAQDIVETTIKRYDKSKRVDFIDMLWLPVKLGLSAKCDAVIVDESQDLTPLQLRFIKSVLMPNSIVLVGDNNQSINQWAGAIPDLLPSLPYDNVKLNFTHRNGINACEYVQNRFDVDHNPAGNVNQNDTVKTVSSYADIPELMPYGLILSRTNAALVDVWHWLVQSGNNAKILGDKKLYYGLLKIIDNYDDMAKREDTDTDFMATATALIKLYGTDAKNAVKRMVSFNDNSQGFTLSTVHKVKGATYDNVALLDNLSGTGETQEEQNIRFVACTRQRNTLILVESE